MCWGLLFFASLQLVIGLAFDLCPQAHDPEFAAKERKLRARLAEDPGRPLVLALGSSRFLLGLDAGRLSAAADGPLVFNFGMSGAGPLLELVCWQRLRGAGIHPQLVLVEVLPALLNQAGDRSLDESWFDGRRLAGGELAAVEPYHSRPGQLCRQWCKARCLPCTWSLEELHGRRAADVPRGGAGTRPAATDAYGWHRHPLTHLDEDERRRLGELVHGQFRRVFGRFHLADRSVQALLALLDRCRGDEIPVALVLMPESSAFRALYPPEVSRGLDLFLAELAKEKRVPLIDARSWVADDAFLDGHHLLPRGAAEFSDRFGREALEPLLGSRGSR